MIVATQTIVELGVAAAVLLVPVLIAVIRVWTRGDRHAHRAIPVRPYLPRAAAVRAPLVLPESGPAHPPRVRITAPLRSPTPAPVSPALANRIDDYLMEALAATGTRLPTNLPPPPRVARGSIAPPPRAETIRDVTMDDFEDDPPTLVSLRPLR
jgi:hypothetical protein